MATIFKRLNDDGATVFQVKIRLAGHPNQHATFERLTDARKWAAATESAIREGRYFPAAESKRHTVTDLIGRYRKDILPRLRSRAVRDTHLDWWDKQLGAYLLADVRPALIVEAGAKLRERPVSNSTANRYCSTLSHAFTVALKEWQWADDNPFRKIKTLREPEGIVRFLSDEEREALLRECKAHGPDLYAFTVLALSTGARRNEILGLTWADVDLRAGLVTFAKTKNGTRRVVPVTGHGLGLLKDLAAARKMKNPAGLVFPGRTQPTANKPLAIDNIFRAALKRAGIEQFRIHDLRHSAASYLVMAGVDMRTVAEILGHRDLKMTHRYAHLSRAHVSDAVGRLDGKLFGASNE